MKLLRNKNNMHHAASMKQNVAEKLKERQEQYHQLAAERRQLLHAQAGLLKSYVSAGVPLPVATSDPSASPERRQQLVAKLTQEEAAARAALEALKQGSSLAKAREIGESVLRETQRIAESCTQGLLQTVSSDDAEAWSTLLQGTGDASAGHQPQSATAPAPGVRQTKAAFSSQAQQQRDMSPSPLQSPGNSSWDTEYEVPGYALHRQQPARQAAQREVSAGNRGSSPAPSQRPHQGAATAVNCSDPGIQQLQAQVTALQTALANQLQPCPAVTNPWGQLLPQLAAMMAHPAAAMAAAAGQHPQAAFGYGGMPYLDPAFAPSSALQGLPPEVAADPSIAAAVSEHARSMALLRMNVEKARTEAELQQIKSQLAASLQQHQQQPHLAVLQDILGNGRRVSGQQQQRQQADDEMQDGNSCQHLHEPVLSGDIPEHAAAAGTASMQHKPSDTDGWLGDMALCSTGLLPAVAAAGAEDEALAAEEASAVLAACGANADTDVLQVHITTAGPFSRRGTYRVCAVLYDGFQPVQCTAGQQNSASTSKRLVTPPGITARSVRTTTVDHSDHASAAAAPAVSGVARFNENLTLKGVVMSSSKQLVFELYMAKPGLAGLPTKEALVGWTAVPLLQGGRVLPGVQSLPLFRLPLMLSAQRKFTYDGALVDFKLTTYRGAPGETDICPAAAGAAHAGAGMGAAGSDNHEDIPGVPTDAWVRVQRGVPPADPYTPGDGLVVVVDGARFLPSSTTISRVLGSAWSSNGAILAGPFEGVSHPDSDALNPRFACTATLGVSHNNTRFEDATATLMLQVQTIERASSALRVVGFALLPLFLDPKAGGQPVSRSIQDYVLNQGAFQVPLHAGAPSAAGPMRASSLDDVPRLPCASLLVRVLTPEAAKLSRRKPAPAYAERVYDTVSRAVPTPLERVMFAKVLQRRPWGVREAARLVAYLSRQPGGLSARRFSHSNSSTKLDAGEAAGGAPVGLLSRVFGSSSDDGTASAARLNTGDPAAAVKERVQDLEDAQAEPLPPSDPEIMDWMSDFMAECQVSALGKSSPAGALNFINLNTAYEYSPDSGFFVALDGAARLARLLPTAGLVSYSPPGSLYQDHPVVDDVKVTLDYDMDAPLAAPRWLDGYQQFAGVPYQPGLMLIVDIRVVLPGSVSSSPQGWACLPVFEPAGHYVASGTYQLPLFQGIPSHQLLAELAASDDPDAVMREAITSGRVRPSLECSSVLVRVMCGSRQGQLEAPAWSLPLQELRLPRYVVSELGPKFVAELRKMIRNKTYSMAKPKNLTDEQFMDQINDTLIKVAGLDAALEGEDSGDEGEGMETAAAPVPAAPMQQSMAAGAGTAASPVAKRQSVQHGKPLAPQQHTQLQPRQQAVPMSPLAAAGASHRAALGTGSRRASQVTRVGVSQQHNLQQQQSMVVQVPLPVGGVSSMRVTGTPAFQQGARGTPGRS